MPEQQNWPKVLKYLTGADRNQGQIDKRQAPTDGRNLTADYADGAVYGIRLRSEVPTKSRVNTWSYEKPMGAESRVAKRSQPIPDKFTWTKDQANGVECSSPVIDQPIKARPHRPSQLETAEPRCHDSINAGHDRQKSGPNLNRVFTSV